MRASQLLFDLLSISLLVWNTLSRPRLRNQRVAEIMIKDGAFFFLVCPLATPYLFGTVLFLYQTLICEVITY